VRGVESITEAAIDSAVVRRGTTTALASPPGIPLDDARAFVQACADGDAAARRLFQDRFADDIYNFPVKIYGLSPEKAADFYVYAFERDRIFLRLRSFEGRGGIQLRTFLGFHVLRGLFLDWQRGEREIDTVSLSTPLGHDDGERVLADVVAAPESEPHEAPAPSRFAELWQSLDAEERLDLKLLSLLEHDLTADDVRLLARISGRSIADTIDAVDEVQCVLRRKDARLSELTAELDSAWGWLALRRRELHDTEERLRLLGSDGEARTKLLARRSELERAIAKRTLQHARALEEIQGYKVTTSYKDIAKLKSSTVGTVCSRMFRLRRRLEERWESAEVRR
jgi:DNA-directed RNA polymerase specialized sigma24 family protein